MPVVSPWPSRPPSSPSQSSGRSIQLVSTCVARLISTTPRTSAAAPTIRITSTSLPRTAGRPRSTRIATSRPARSDAIIPVAAQPKTRRLTRPKAVAGEASFSICRVTLAPPLSDSGSASTISLDHARAEIVVAEHDAEDRDEDDRERYEREEDAVRDARCVLAAAVGEVAVDRLRGSRERACAGACRASGRAASATRAVAEQPERPPSGKSRHRSGTAPSAPGTLPAASFPGSSIGRAFGC